MVYAHTKPRDQLLTAIEFAAVQKPVGLFDKGEFLTCCACQNVHYSADLGVPDRYNTSAALPPEWTPGLFPQALNYMKGAKLIQD